MRRERSGRLDHACCAMVALLALCSGLAGCAKKKRSAKSPPVPVARYSETGIATWYGHPYHGRQAANGEIYDMEKMTAAHRTLPFGTIVRVTNLTNAKTTEVRITDRGPFVEGRIIDLSHAAAREIDVIRPGTARVKVEATSAPPVLTGLYGVQVGAFREKGNAERLRSELARSFSPVELSERTGNTKIWRVVVGRKPTLEEAQRLADELAKERDNVFVVRLD